MEKDLFSNFDVNGYWWLPGSANAPTAGNLRFENDVQIELSVQGSLVGAPSGFAVDHRPAVIYGINSKNDLFTLFVNLRTNHVENFPGFEESTYSARFLAVGAHLLSFDALQITELLIRFPGLEYSTAHHWFSKSDPDPAFINLRWTRPKQFNVWIPAIQAHLGLHFGLTGRGIHFLGSGMQLTANHKAYFKIVPSKVISLEWCWIKIMRLQQLITLLYGFPTCPLEVHVSAGAEDKIQLFFVQDKGAINQTPLLHDLLVPFLSLKKHHVSLLFRTWFHTGLPFRTAVELLNGTMSQSGLYTRLEFINHVQNLEAFHRAVYKNGGVYMSQNTYKAIKDVLTAAIPGTVAPAHRAKLESTIAFGYEKSQAKRIEELVFSLPQPVQDFLAQRPKQFVRTMVDTRNRYTHYDPADSKVIFSDREMAICNYGLRLFLLFLFLRYLKIPDPTIFSGIQRLPSWRVYSQNRTW